jgi:hypothetical protein
MKKPKNTAELKSLIYSMKHRERFVFDMKDGRMLEVYHTHLNDFAGDRNICLTIVLDEIDHKPQNRLLKLWTESSYERIFNLIKD